MNILTDRDLSRCKELFGYRFSNRNLLVQSDMVYKEESNGQNPEQEWSSIYH